MPHARRSTCDSPLKKTAIAITCTRRSNFFLQVRRQIRSLLHQLGAVLGLFEEQRIHLLSQAASDLNLTFVVDEDQAERLVAKLHARLFASRSEDALFGPSWETLFDRAGRPGLRVLEWWVQRKAQLLALAEEHSPLFVIDPLEVDRAADRLVAMDALDRRFFAIKANAHEGILRLSLIHI